MIRFSEILNEQIQFTSKAFIHYALKNCEDGEDSVIEERADDYYYLLLDNFGADQSKKATIYRAIQVNGYEDIDKNHAGIFWSFSREHAMPYGQVPEKFKNGKYVVLTAEVSFKDVDIEKGLYSYIYYDQDECALNQNTAITLIAIDDEPVEREIVNTGNKQSTN